MLRAVTSNICVGLKSQNKTHLGSNLFRSGSRTESLAKDIITAITVRTTFKRVPDMVKRPKQEAPTIRQYLRSLNPLPTVERKKRKKDRINVLNPLIKATPELVEYAMKIKREQGHYVRLENVMKITSEDLKKQTEEAELRMTQMKEKQQRSVELNAAKMSGKKIKANVDKDAEEVEEEPEETETPDPARAGVLAALEREREIEAKLRSEEVARDVAEASTDATEPAVEIEDVNNEGSTERDEAAQKRLNKLKKKLKLKRLHEFKQERKAQRGQIPEEGSA